MREPNAPWPERCSTLLLAVRSLGTSIEPRSVPQRSSRYPPGPAPPSDVNAAEPIDFAALPANAGKDPHSPTLAAAVQTTLNQADQTRTRAALDGVGLEARRLVLDAGPVGLSDAAVRPSCIFVRTCASRRRSRYSRVVSRARCSCRCHSPDNQGTLAMHRTRQNPSAARSRRTDGPRRRKPRPISARSCRPHRYRVLTV